MSENKNWRDLGTLGGGFSRRGFLRGTAFGVAAGLAAGAAEKAGSVEPQAVLQAMKAGGKGLHAFGEADWWGKELIGIDNALVGNWPVVAIENGKAVIKKFRSPPAWWAKHKDVMIKHFEAKGEMYYQRT